MLFRSLSAAAITVAYFAGGSNGGSEIVTGLVSVKNPHVEMGKVLLIFNLGVYALAFALQRELMQVLYSLLMPKKKLSSFHSLFNLYFDQYEVMPHSIILRKQPI